jgi:Flp pilus assembly protein TadG
MEALKKLRLGRGRRRGAALVESAIVMPLVILMVFGVIEYGWMFLKSQQISNACRTGARAGARYGATAGTVTSAVSTSMTNDGFTSGQYSVTLTPSDPTSLSPGQSLTVQITVPYSNIAAINIALIPTPTNLRASVVMAREGP